MPCSKNGALDPIFFALIDLDEFTLKYNIISSQGVPLCRGINSASFTIYCTWVFKTTAIRYYNGKAIQEAKEVFQTDAADIQW